MSVAQNPPAAPSSLFGPPPALAVAEAYPRSAPSASSQVEAQEIEEILQYVTRVMQMFEKAWYIYAKAPSHDKQAHKLYQKAVLTSQAFQIAVDQPNMPLEVRGYVKFRLRASPWLQTAQIRS
ncbi:hypothetical protein EST38_g3 [Candolleomyces aberdarensis]|uniref:Uncharacterized protein n=1 Tax=Candolleomyces aberdarensis TaxID=2316362 RepID=A0A4Q2DZB4_9AGAR|nr:hypothetical protein EST38_g3 [Candolleomyces aberdarensis]